MAGTATIEVDLDFVAGERDARGTPVECDAYAASVGFSPGGDAEEFAVGGSGGHVEGGGAVGGATSGGGEGCGW